MKTKSPVKMNFCTYYWEICCWRKVSNSYCQWCKINHKWYFILFYNGLLSSSPQLDGGILIHRPALLLDNTRLPLILKFPHEEKGKQFLECGISIKYSYSQSWWCKGHNCFLLLFFFYSNQYTTIILQVKFEEKHFVQIRSSLC